MINIRNNDKNGDSNRPPKSNVLHLFLSALKNLFSVELLAILSQVSK